MLSVVMATTTDAVITSVILVVHTSVCWTAGIAAISVIMVATCVQTVFTARRPMVILTVAEVYAPVQPVPPSTILVEEEAIVEEVRSVEAVASEAEVAIAVADLSKEDAVIAEEVHSEMIVAILEEARSVAVVALETAIAGADRSVAVVVLEAATAVVVHSAVAVPLVEEEA